MAKKRKMLYGFLVLACFVGTLNITQNVMGIGIITPPPTTVSYRGYIKNTDSGPIKNAYVKLYINGAVKDTDYSASNGYYYLSAINPSGTVEIKVFKSGYLNQSKTVSTNGGFYNYKLKGLWALVVDGQQHNLGSDYYDERFTRDAANMYQTIRDHYGFSSSRSYLLIAQNRPNTIPIPYSYTTTTKANIISTFSEIAAGACSGDQVLIWWTGHGEVDTCVCNKFNFTADEFSDCLDAITCKEMYIFLGQCHSGSFIDDLNDRANRAIYTSCTSDQLGKVYTPPLSNTPTHSLFPWATYLGLGSNFADANHNYRVSLSELFEYCYTFVQNNLPPNAPPQNPKPSVGSAINEAEAYIGTGFPIP